MTSGKDARRALLSELRAIANKARGMDVEDYQKNSRSLGDIGIAFNMFQRIIRILIVAACMCLPCLGFASGQGTHIYKGKYTNYSDIVYTWDGEHLYRGKYANYSDVVLTWDGKHIYRGRYKNYSDILYTWDGKYLYRGRYSNYSDILYTWDGRHVYSGRYPNYSDVVLTYDGKHVYKSRYTNYSDIILTCGAPIPVPILLWVLM